MTYNKKAQEKYDLTSKGKFRKTKYELSKKGRRTRRISYLRKKQKQLEEKLKVE